MLIDDEEMILEASKLLLEDIADHILIATSGANALKILESEKVHCIVCDINMPEMNGVEVLRRVRELGLNTPFIFYTGHGAEAHMKEAMKYGAFDFLNKPALDGLEETIEHGLHEGMGQKHERPISFTSEYRKLLKKELNA